MRRAIAAGVAVLALVASACALAWRPDSPLVPRHGGNVSGTAPLFLVLLIAAFAAYLACALRAPAHAPRHACRDRARRRDPARAAGRTAPPLHRRLDVLVVRLDRSAQRRQSVLRSAGGLPGQSGDRLHGKRLARHDDASTGRRSRPPRSHWRSSPATPTRSQRGRTRHSRPRPPSLPPCSPVASRGGVPSRSRSSAGTRSWRSMLAGGGHNDAWVGALILAALALSASRRAQAGGALWVLAIAVKWVPALFLALRSLESRATGRPHGARGLAGAAAGIAIGATVLYGGAWPLAIFPLVGNAALETSYAFPHRLEQLGLPDDLALAVAIAALVVGLVLLARSAAARPRATRARRLPRARDDPLPRRLVPGVGRSGRRRRGGHRRDGCRARALRLPAAPDDPDLRPG